MFKISEVPKSDTIFSEFGIRYSIPDFRIFRFLTFLNKIRTELKLYSNFQDSEFPNINYLAYNIYIISNFSDYIFFVILCVISFKCTFHPFKVKVILGLLVLSNKKNINFNLIKKNK